MAATGPIYGGARYSLARRRVNSNILVVKGSKDDAKETRSNNLE